MTWSSNRLEINGANALRAVIALVLATVLGLAGCAGDHEDDMPDDGEASSAVVPSTSIFKAMDAETLLGGDRTRSATDKIRSGIPAVQDRILYAGVSMSGNSCDGASGTRVFNAFSDATVLGFFNDAVIDFMNAHPNVQFGCAMGVNEQSGLAAFHCDNNGALYGLL